MFSLAFANIVVSQELNIADGGGLYVSSGSYIYIDGGVNVGSNGALEVDSDASNSGSLLVQGNVVGDITYRRFVDSSNWHFISSPVTTQNIGVFASDVNNGIQISGTGNFGISFYKNDNLAGQRWQYYTQAAGPLGAVSAGDFVNGTGYSLLRSGSGKYSFKGEVVTGDVSVVIPPFSSTTHLWSLVGNPYPSFINAQSLLSSNSGVLDPAFTQLNTWNGTEYVPVNFATGGSIYIAPGQGFMLKSNISGGTFQFLKSSQSEQKDLVAAFYKTAPVPSIDISLVSGKKSKKTTIKFFENTTKGLDPGWDAGSYRDGEPDFSIDTHLVSESQDIDFTLQCLPNSDYESYVIPLSVNSAANQTLVFKATAENLPEGLVVYLEDKLLNTMTSISEFSHEILVTDNLKGVGRFYVHTKNSVLNNDDIPLANISVFKTNNNSIRIRGMQAQNNSKFSMYSITGKMILAKEFISQNVNDIELPKILASGVYLVKIVSSQSRVTKKIVIE